MTSFLCSRSDRGSLCCCLKFDGRGLKGNLPLIYIQSHCGYKGENIMFIVRRPGYIISMLLLVTMSLVMSVSCCKLQSLHLHKEPRMRGRVCAYVYKRWWNTRQCDRDCCVVPQGTPPIGLLSLARALSHLQDRIQEGQRAAWWSLSQ